MGFAYILVVCFVLIIFAMVVVCCFAQCQHTNPDLNEISDDDMDTDSSNLVVKE